MRLALAVRRMSQAKLAACIGASEAAVSQWLGHRGRRKLTTPSGPFVAGITEVLRLRPLWLFGDGQDDEIEADPEPAGPVVEREGAGKKEEASEPASVEEVASDRERLERLERRVSEMGKRLGLES